MNKALIIFHFVVSTYIHAVQSLIRQVEKTEDTLTGFQEFFLRPIIKEQYLNKEIIITEQYCQQSTVHSDICIRS